MYVDPTGELSKFWKRLLNTVFTSVFSVLTGGAVPFAAVVSSWIVGTIDGLSNGRSFSDALHQGGSEACVTAWTATAAFGLSQLIGPIGQDLFQKSFNKMAAGASVLADKIATGINSVLSTSLNVQDVYNLVNGIVGGGGGMAGSNLFHFTSDSSDGGIFNQLWYNYPSNSIIHPGSSGGDIFSDHCAINMSEALMKSGINLSGGTRCWGYCPSGGGHFIRAQELANALNDRYNVTKLNSSNFYGQIKGKQGIIFFQDYWQRAGELGRTGDHIDLWNGSYLKSNGWILTRLRLNFPNMMEGFGSSSLYHSKSVYFWEFYE